MARDTGPIVVDFDGGIGLGSGHLEQNARIILFDASVFDAAPSLGEGLKAARLFYGLSLQDVAALTKVRLAYLVSIEDMKFQDLPSRPFAQGYVRAYAQCLGLDDAQALTRFRAEVPDEAEGLAKPIGIERQKQTQIRTIAAIVLAVFAAVLVWNIIQRNLQSQAQSRALVPDIEQAASGLPASMRPAQTGTANIVQVGAPMPAPAESTLPNAYITPGLAEATAAGGSVDRAQAAAKAALAAGEKPVQTIAVSSSGAPTFTPKGTIYGASAQQSVVTLQASRGASIIVRGVGGSIYFARQLAPGEAYRAPLTRGLTVDVSDPTAIDVYVSGVKTTPLSGNVTSLSRIGG
jgi:cytoskeletal protein RodZ